MATAGLFATANHATAANPLTALILKPKAPAMGVIDSNKYELHCLTCSQTEIAIAHQRGSRFGARWQGQNDLLYFNVKWVESDGSLGLTETCCKKCQAHPNIRCIG